MRTSPSLIPFNHATVYLVLDDFNEQGRAWRETGEDQTTRDVLLENLLTGKYERPRLVIAFNLAEGWSRDASAEIAREAVERARREHVALLPSVLEFVDEICRSLEEAQRR
jgi:hypothetical protein